MNWIRGMLSHFARESKKNMNSLGRDEKVYLLAYQDRSLTSEGISTNSTPQAYELPNALVVPFAAYRFGRVFGRELDRKFYGQIETGDAILFVDEKKLQDAGIVIDLELDEVQWNENRYKIMKWGEYHHYQMVSIYLLKRIPEV